MYYSFGLTEWWTAGMIMYRLGSSAGRVGGTKYPPYLTSSPQNAWGPVPPPPPPPPENGAGQFAEGSSERRPEGYVKAEFPQENFPAGTGVQWHAFNVVGAWLWTDSPVVCTVSWFLGSLDFSLFARADCQGTGNMSTGMG